MSDMHASRMTLLPDAARPEAVALLARAFHTDPFFTYLFPEDSLRPAMMGEVMGAFLRVLSLRGSACCLGAPELAGVIGIQRPGERSSTWHMVQGYGPTRRITHLETSRPENVGYYQRFGFDVVTELNGSTGAPVWVMTRPAVR